MIDFKDFFPERIEQKSFAADDKYETCNSLLKKVEQWEKETEAKIINIETVELGEKESQLTRFMAKEPFLYQFIRVWYQRKNEVHSELEDK